MKPLFESLGLSEKEAVVYDFLLKEGELPVTTIAKKLSLPRPTVYRLLYELEEKKLVSHRDKHKKIQFRPEHPQQLVSFAQQQAQQYERTQSQLLQVLPDLTSTFVLTTEKPAVTTFEGIKGLKEIYEDTLRVQKPIYAVLTTATVDPVLFEWLTTTYGKERTKKNIPAYVIVSTGSWSAEYQKRDAVELRTTRVVPHGRFPFQHEVDIYGDKVAFITYKKGEPLIGIIIHNRQIAQTMKAWFDLSWEAAEHYEVSG